MNYLYVASLFSFCLRTSSLFLADAGRMATSLGKGLVIFLFVRVVTMIVMSLQNFAHVNRDF